MNNYYELIPQTKGFACLFDRNPDIAEIRKYLKAHKNWCIFDGNTIISGKANAKESMIKLSKKNQFKKTSYITASAIIGSLNNLYWDCAREEINLEAAADELSELERYAGGFMALIAAEYDGAVVDLTSIKLPNPDRNVLISFIRKTCTTGGVNIFFITNDSFDLNLISGFTYITKDGAVINKGPIRELTSNPVDPYTAAVAGFPPMNLFSGKLTSALADTILFIDTRSIVFERTKVEDIMEGASDGEKILVGIRPEGFVPVKGDADITAKVNDVFSFGYRNIVRFDVGCFSFCAELPADFEVAAGEVIDLDIDKSKLYFFKDYRPVENDDDMSLDFTLRYEKKN